MPCSSMYSGSTGSSAPKPMVTIICTAKTGSSGCQRVRHAEIRSCQAAREVGIDLSLPRGGGTSGRQRAVQDRAGGGRDSSRLARG